MFDLADAAFQAHAQQLLGFDGNSSGSSLKTCLQNPLTIMLTASSGEMPPFFLQ